MRRMSLAAALLVLALVQAPAAVAQVPTQDSVTGSGFLSFGAGQGPCQLEVDARSGPSGEEPSGRTLCSPLPGPPGSEVTCLNVQRNVALLTIVRLDTGSVASFRITDNGPGVPDVVEGNFGPGCPEPQLFYFDLGLSSGDFVVVDAPPLPTSKGQCNNDGWQSFGLFANQGDCVSFVATAGKNPPAGGSEPAP
jgi:hypothetical protein